MLVRLLKLLGIKLDAPSTDVRVKSAYRFCPSSIAIYHGLLFSESWTELFLQKLWRSVYAK
jgi:hypothetical protein